MLFCHKCGKELVEGAEFCKTRAENACILCRAKKRWQSQWGSIVTEER